MQIISDEVKTEDTKCYESSLYKEYTCKRKILQYNKIFIVFLQLKI